jgi:hypothetical protein
VLPVTPLGGDPAKITDARERWLATTLKTFRTGCGIRACRTARASAAATIRRRISRRC